MQEEKKKKMVSFFLPHFCIKFHLHEKYSARPTFVSVFRQELGLIDAFGNSLEKKPTLSIDDDQAKWKSDKQAKEAADKQARPILFFQSRQ